MISKKSGFLILLFLLLLVTFDALQQKYYVETFNLANEPLSIATLLKSHLLRWFIWLIICIPFAFFIWKKIHKIGVKSLTLKVSTYAAILGAVLTSISVVSAYSIFVYGLEFESATISEQLTFFFYQKGLVFFLAYVSVMFLLVNQFNSNELKAQEFEIINLKKSNQVKRLSDSETHLSIKTGNKLNTIALNKIIWIQADDYCVRIHTEDRTFTLRKSLKTLEEQLKPFKFIRVHRGALLNLSYVEQINLDSSTIRLQNEAELPVSRSGLRTLKDRIKESSI